MFPYNLLILESLCSDSQTAQIKTVIMNGSKQGLGLVSTSLCYYISECYQLFKTYLTALAEILQGCQMERLT